jgi:hypothetical protein
MVSHTHSAGANGVDQVLPWSDNEHHLLLASIECRHSALAVEIRSGHRALFEGISDMRKLMAAASKPKLATIIGSCMQSILLGLEAGLEGQPIINTGF